MTESRILVCGGREYKDRQRIAVVLNDYINSDDLVISGGCRGADTLAAEWATALGARVRYFFPDWEKHGRAAGPIRNQDMLDHGKPDLVIAFPGGSGTADMVRRAKAAGVRVVEISSCPSGERLNLIQDRK